MKNIFFLFLTLTVPTQVFAAGSITLQGVVRGFSHDSIELSDGSKIYSISKKKLTATQEAQISKIKTGDKLTLSVSFDAITAAKAAK